MMAYLNCLHASPACMGIIVMQDMSCVTESWRRKVCMLSGLHGDVFFGLAIRPLIVNNYAYGFV